MDDCKVLFRLKRNAWVALTLGTVIVITLIIAVVVLIAPREPLQPPTGMSATETVLFALENEAHTNYRIASIEILRYGERDAEYVKLNTDGERYSNVYDRTIIYVEHGIHYNLFGWRRPTFEESIDLLDYYLIKETENSDWTVIGTGKVG